MACACVLEWKRPEKTKASRRFLAATLLFFLFENAEAFVDKGLAVLACTRSNHRVFIPKKLCGESVSGQHPI
jgi:hypothetical protein